MTRTRNACHLNLEWDPDEAKRPEVPCRLARPATDRVMSIAEALLDRGSDQRATLANAFDLFRSIGAPCGLSVEALDGEPTDRDRSFAHAIERQLENLASHESTKLQMSESLHLSERQIHRLFEEFSARFGINARSWRDVRNRWRVQNAALLLSRRELTVADVAREVGYTSPNALARAFSKSGFPSPAVIRDRMSEMDPLP